MNDGSYDNCGDVTLNNGLEQIYVNRDYPYTQGRYLTVTDESGNTATCLAVIFVTDTDTPPVAKCKDITVGLDESGNATIAPADVDDGSYYTCDGITNMTLSQTTFDCTNIGGNTVTLSASNLLEKTGTCEATVTVEDNIAPVVNCIDVTIALFSGSNGSPSFASIVNASLYEGVSDNCAAIEPPFERYDFSCEDVGTHQRTITVKDESGNETSCTANITVADLFPVTRVDCQDLTIQLDESGIASIEVSEIEKSSFDKCGIVSRLLDQATFDCSNLGTNTVTLTVEGVSGNTASCEATVTVEDNIAPNLVCQDLTIQLEDGIASIPTSAIVLNKTDNCEANIGDTEILNFDTDDAGKTIEVSHTIVDAAGNTASCIANVTIEGLTQERLSPILEGVNFDTDKKKYVACFGYLNGNTGNVTVEIGGDNKFTPGTDLGQPTEFLPGRQVSVFCIPMETGQNYVWTLTGPDGQTRTATAGFPNNDVDGDGVIDEQDNCPDTFNAGQADNDNDGVGNVCDNCPDKKNSGQKDSDGDGIGDACDPCPNLSNLIDTDGDGISDCEDNCIDEPNVGQADKDNDGIGDKCDNCPDKKNSGQKDSDGDGIGDACDPCPNLSNLIDTDGDGISDC
ncbi:MAG: thrombospondin type 3 repeat-containing protein, partial [Saprospiraceae bacterium]|nr:thrombospondin type 3 repeat-containing protein [Saprospiraceae bacterium]